MSEVKSDEEEMKEEIDTVKGLLGRLQNERNKELNEDEHKRESQDEVISEIHQKAVSMLINLKSPEERVVVKRGNIVEKMDIGQDESSDQTDETNGDNVGSHKRKQDRFLLELHEKAEVISKSARTSAEGVITKIDSAPNLEEDPEAGEFLRKIRSSDTNSKTVAGHSPTCEDQSGDMPPSKTVVVMRRSENMNEKVKRRHTITPVLENAEEIENRRHTTTAVIDFASIPSDFPINLNLDPQKARISLVKQGGLKDRRLPTAANRRSGTHSLLLFDSTFDDEAEEEDDHKTETASSGLKPSPSVVEGLKPRITPKPKVKSKTVAGIALPGLAEAIQARQLRKTEFSKKFNAADLRKNTSAEKTGVTTKFTAAELVKGAKAEKEKQAVKEDRVEREPQKPAWLLEAEARRKHHDRRRLQKPKAEPSTAPSSTPTSTATVSVSSSTRHAVVSNGIGDKPIAVRATVSLPPADKDEVLVQRGTLVDDLPVKAKNGRTVIMAKPVKDHKESASAVVAPQRIHRVSDSDKNTASEPVTPSAVVKPHFEPRKTRKIIVASRKSEEELIIKATPEKSEGDIICSSPTRVSSYKVLDVSVEESRSPSVSPSPSLTSHSVPPISLQRRVPSSPTKTIVNGSTMQQSGSAARVSSVEAKPRPKPKPKPTVTSTAVTVKAGEIPYRRHHNGDVESSRRHIEPQVRPVSMPVIHGNRTKSTSQGDDARDYGDYRPLITGEVIPQWKRELMQRKKTSRDETGQQSHAEAEQPVAGLVVVPTWKRDLMERRKATHRDQPPPSTEMKSTAADRGDAVVEPPWMRELNQRKRRSGSSPVKVSSSTGVMEGRKPAKEADESSKVPEFRKKLSGLRQSPIVIIPQKSEDIETKPSFMKEFEKKKRIQARGPFTFQRTSTQSYV